MTERRLASLLQLDPQLGQLVPPGRIADARAALKVRMAVLPTGEWDTERLARGARAEHVGLLMLAGVVTRDILIGGSVSTELLGPGDVLRPWMLETPPWLLSREVRWNVLRESRVAVLDRDVAVRLAQWPEVNQVLIDRLSERAERLATSQAISQLIRVDRRVLALLWHVAERWGRVTPDGVVVPLALSHRMLGQLVGARRPTVSTAVRLLEGTGELRRRRDGSWLLGREPMGLQAAGEAGRIVPLRPRPLTEAEGAVPRKEPAGA
jgi:CRP/FNR family cyclic AMP-dependent transcriptional regulator